MVCSGESCSAARLDLGCRLRVSDSHGISYNDSHRAMPLVLATSLRPRPCADAAARRRACTHTHAQTPYTVLLGHSFPCADTRRRVWTHRHTYIEEPLHATQVFGYIHAGVFTHL